MGLYRIEYSITDQAAYLSHLEVMKTFERALRRAQIPLAFSEGFNPHPKIAIAAPLSVGMAGKHEYLDLETRADVLPMDLKEKLNNSLPQGMEILKARVISRTKPLMAVINAASYRVEMDAGKIDKTGLSDAVQVFLSQEVFPLERHTQKVNKIIDVRKGVYDLKIAFSVLSFDLEMLLAMGNEGNIRPDEVVRAIFSYLDGVNEDAVVQTVRTGLFIYHGGKRILPMNFGSEELV